MEIAFDGVQTSPRYPGGVALRFARVLRYRPDKPAREASTLEEVLAIHARQAARTTGRPGWPGWSAIAARRSGRCSPSRLLAAAPRRRSERFTRRYEWASRGRCCTWTPSACSALTGPGTGRHGDRAEQPSDRGAGYVYAHCVVDDHSRLAYVELHGADDRARRPPPTLERAAAWMREQGCGPAEAVMTDNAFGLRHSHALPRRSWPSSAHATSAPRPTRRAGTARSSASSSTLDDEWAHGRVWPNSTRRDRALASFLRYYNRRRPHTSLGDRPPISRVHQDRGQDS